MSRQKSPTDIVSAIYNAEKQEVVHSFYVAISFIIAGIITIIVSLVKFAKISGNAMDSSDNINSFAWLVIAVVGLVVALVGAVTIIKSMVGLGQIGSAAETMESHASPFHAQEVTHQATAMNQSLSMRNTIPNSSDGGMLGEKGKTASKGAPPVVQAPKAEPIMQQKFDYGIHEKKELTFAEKFMLENKKDPFEQYRKELGIEEKSEEAFFEPKPQFIPSSNSQAPTVIQQQPTLQKQPIAQQQAAQRPTLQKQPVFQQQTTQQPTLQKQPIAQQQAAQRPTLQKQPVFQQQTTQQPTLQKQPIAQQQAAQQPVLQKQPIVQQQSIPQKQSVSFKDSSPAKTAPKFNEQRNRFVSKGNDNEADSIINKYLDSNYNTGTGTAASATYSSKEEQDNFFNNYGKDNPKAESSTAGTGTSDGSAPTEDLSKVNNIFESSQGLDFGSSDPVSFSDVSEFTAYNDASAGVSDVDQDDGFNFDLEYTTTLQDKSFENYFPQNTAAGLEIMGTTNKSEAFDVRKFLAKSSNTTTPAPMQNNQGQKPTAAPTAPKHNFDLFTESKSNRKTTQNERDTAENNAKAKSKTNLFSAFKTNKKSPVDEQPKQEKPKVNHEICVNGTPSQRKYVEASAYDEWTCPECGKVNQEYVGMCACGRRKPYSKN